jgi:hypothetical protein
MGNVLDLYEIYSLRIPFFVKAYIKCALKNFLTFPKCFSCLKVKHSHERWNTHNQAPFQHYTKLFL